MFKPLAIWLCLLLLSIKDSERIYITPSHLLSQTILAVGQSQNHTKPQVCFQEFNH